MKKNSYTLVTRRKFQEKVYSWLRVARLKKPVRKCYAVRYSEDHGETWQLLAVCDVCFHSIEPPRRACKAGDAGVNFCDWCACVNGD